VADVLDRLAVPAVLVGHSYGGAVVTQAAVWHPDVAHLVYLAAFALDDGESVMSLLRSLPAAPVALSGAIRPGPDGTTVLDPASAAAALYGDVVGPAVEAAVARLSPQSVASMTDAVQGAPRRHIDSTYVQCLRDEAVHPSHQAVMAERCTGTITLDCDHSPFLSATGDVAELLVRLARGRAASTKEAAT
jgi:pimeloyl-ACP methyl ester carboxylesterase